MHPRRSPGRTVRRARVTIMGWLGFAMLVTVAAAGCNGSAQSPGTATRTKVTACGTAKTAAAVPVRVEVTEGHISCGAARAVVRAYADAIRSGHAPGNGGGGPVKINGWTCQGFATPIVLQTGKTSRCVRGGVEILEILPPPPSPSAS